MPTVPTSLPLRGHFSADPCLRFGCLSSLRARLTLSTPSFGAGVAAGLPGVAAGVCSGCRV